MPVLGELERQVMELLWRSDVPMTVRQVHAVLVAERDLAYTTVLTVLDRLAKKDIVHRSRAGRQWLYRPASTMPDLFATQLLESLPTAHEDRLACLTELFGRLSDAERAALAGALQRSIPAPGRQSVPAGTQEVPAVDRGFHTSASTGPLNCD